MEQKNRHVLQIAGREAGAVYGMYERARIVAERLRRTNHIAHFFKIEKFATTHRGAEIQIQSDL
jgi:hypothetical protein